MKCIHANCQAEGELRPTGECRVCNRLQIRYPVIHLNGTSARSLLRQYTEARNALRSALDAVSNAAPNARDYYLLGDAAFPAANKEHVERLRKLETMLHEMEALSVYADEYTHR